VSIENRSSSVMRCSVCRARVGAFGRARSGVLVGHRLELVDRTVGHERDE
jgi:hypothetical protein